MTRQRTAYPTRHSIGRLVLVTFRHSRGFAIMDRRTRTIEYTTPHPVSGRPIPALEPDYRRALRIAAEIIADAD